MGEEYRRAADSVDVHASDVRGRAGCRQERRAGQRGRNKGAKWAPAYQHEDKGSDGA
jgi:hypothetical protein